jgi:hypothetical protein
VRAGRNDELGYPSDLRAIALALVDDEPAHSPERGPPCDRVLA